MPKNSKIKVVDIDNNTLDTITETIDTPMAETVESNIVESVEIHNDEEVNLLPKPKAKSKSRAKPKESVQTDILNEVEIIKPKPKAKSRAKPKDEDVEFLDDEVEEVPVKAKAKAKSKAKLIPEEESEIIDAAIRNLFIHSNIGIIVRYMLTGNDLSSKKYPQTPHIIA